MSDASPINVPKGERQLWAAVVLQAAEDIDCEAYGSTDYEQSVCFFISGGDWAMWRGHVAQMMDLHEDDLSRLGRARIAARALRDPPPPRARPIGLVVKPVTPPLAPPPAAVVRRPVEPPRVACAVKPEPARKPWQKARSNAWLAGFIAIR